MPSPLQTSAAPQDRPGSALAKAFRLLETLVAAGRPLSLAELTEGAGLPKASVHRMLLQMEEVGAVRREVGPRFAPGAGFMALALQGVARAATGAPVRAVMERLVEDLGESVNLAVLDGREVLYLERVECARQIRVHLKAGSRVPVHCTAAGKLLLAAMPAEARRQILATLALTRFTAHTLCTPEALEAACAGIREHGYSLNEQEYAEGLGGAAVPVPGPDGRPAAALAVHAPVFRMDRAAAEAAVPRLHAAASEIAALLAGG